jgi:CHAD domain-containing protein
MLEKWIPIVQEQPGVIQDPSKLTEILREKRRGEEELAVRYFSSGAATPVLLEIWAGILDMRWDEKADCPIGDFEKKRLGDWSSKFIDGLDSQDFSEIKETHALRILGKKIRYARSAVLPERDGGPRSDPEKLKLLQTLLGELCDAGRNAEILKGIMEESADRQLSLECGMLIGYQMHEAEKLIPGIKKAMKKDEPEA